MIRYIILFIAILCSTASPAQVRSMHAIATHGTPKYPATFKHLDYVNPDAPKGGTLLLSSIGNFDSLNPFILKGVPAEGLSYLFDTLTRKAGDEPSSEYGLLAEQIIVPEDRSWVEFRLRRIARFFDGTPVTADDVVFTFNALREKGQPFFRSYYAEVDKVIKTGEYSVKFTFKSKKNRELPLIIGQMPVLSKKYYDQVVFDKTTLEPPLGSGPYSITDIKPGRSITYQRRENYWAKDLPVNKGFFNADTIRFEYYRDSSVALEAFKAGRYDFRLENISKNWATAYDFPAVRDKRVKLLEVRNEIPAGMQGFLFNLRREKFQDTRVRQALNYAFDFEWMNKNLFFSIYQRTTSYFANTNLAATGVPEGEELKLLEPYRAELPEELFSLPFALPTNPGKDSFRYNMRKATKLLQEAGYKIAGNTLVDKDNNPLTFEILLDNPSFERVAAAYVQNLKKLGIQVSVRTVDPAQYKYRADNFDFDMIVGLFAQSPSPGNEQRSYWSSKLADTPGSQNSIGIKNKVVDALVEKIIQAKDLSALRTRVQALDRVLLWNYYLIPHWYSGKFRIAYWDRFGKPSMAPKYELGFPDTWWIKPDTTLVR